MSVKSIVSFTTVVFVAGALGLVFRDFRQQQLRQVVAVEALVVEMRKLNLNHYMLATEITNVCFEVEASRKRK